MPFSFFKNLGKDLFDREYQKIRRYTNVYKIKTALRKTEKALKIQIDEDPELSQELATYLKKDEAPTLQATLGPVVTAYLLVTWVLGASSTSNGFGFPFDQPHLVFYQRLQQAYPKLNKLKDDGVQTLPLGVVNKVLADPVLQNSQKIIEQKIPIFNALRDAMRIACTDSVLGLNDKGIDDIDNIEKRVKAFRHSEKLKALAANANDTSYLKMIKQIDKYWEKGLPNQFRLLHQPGQSLSNRNEPII